VAGYRLGVDLGTTWTAAAVERDGPATVVALSQRSQAIPTVVHLGADGTVLVGDAAVRRGLEDPERVAREMKRRIGDSTPILLGGSPWSPELLQARVLRWVVDHVTAEQGGPPDAVTVTHPANWGAFKVDLLLQAIRQVGLADVRLLPEPVAAAAWYANQHRVAEGDAIAVYDLGGGTFDTAVVRRSATGFEVLGHPDGVERLGGIDFDAAVLAHVVRQVAEAWDALDPSDPEVVADAAALRDRCIEAKEALSADSTVAIPVRLPAVRTTVRLTRDELEQMVRGPLGETIAALRRTIDSAGLAPADLAAVLLVGGSSRIPLVAELVSAGIGVPVAVDANPKFAVALGAARSPGSAAAPPAETPVTPAAPTPRLPPPAPPPSPPRPAAADEGPPRAGARSGRSRGLLVAGIVAAVALVGGGIALLGGEGDGDDDGDGGSEAGSEPPGEAGAAEGDGVLRIGLLLPADDDTGFVAPAMQAAAELAVADVNDAGGVLGAPIELTTVDTGAGSEEEVTAAVDELVDQGVDLVVGPVPAATVAAAAVQVADAGLAGCSAHDTQPGSLTDDDDRWFRTIPTTELQALAITEAIADDGHRTIGLVAPSDQAELAGDIVGALEEAGIDVDVDLDFERGALDVTPTIMSLRDTGATAEVLVGSDELALVVEEGDGPGLRGPFYVDETFESEAVGRRVADAVGAGAEVLLVTVSEVPGFGVDGTVTARVAEELAGLGDTFPFAAPYVYDCIVLAAVAAESAGSDHPDAVADAVVDASDGGESCTTTDCLPAAAAGDDVDYEGESGVVDLDDAGEVTSGEFVREHWGADAVLVFDSVFEVGR
jgi:ABC-type branched-subunit amino acid transport system substrate-binding protein/actin-like ATPase involved in cell morphogenesis